MKESSKDNFEQFFKKSLEHYQENPSNDFWSEMEDRIPPPPVSRFSFWKNAGRWGLLILLLGILSIVSWQWWQQQKDIDSIYQTIDLQSEKIDDVEAQLDQVIQNSKGKSLSENLLSERKEKSKKQNNYYNRKNSKTLSDQGNTDSIVKTDLTPNTNNENISGIKSILKVEGKEKAILEYKKISDVEFIPSLFLEVSKKEKECLTCIEEQLYFGYAPSKKRGLEFFVNSSQLFPKLDLLNSGFNINFQKARDYDFGLLYHIPIYRKWSFQFGIGVGSNTISTRFQKAFTYSNTEFSISDDIFRTNYFYQLNTNYNGIVNFTTYLHNEKQNDGQDVLVGDAFTTEIQINKKQRYLTIPFFIKHQWHQGQGKLNWTWKTGVIQRLAYIKNEPISVEINNFSNSRLSHHSTTIVDVGEEEKKRFDTAIVLSTGVEYLVSRNLVFVLEPTFKQTLIQRGNERPRTFGLFTGIRWNFIP